jgi:hypothetical protein
LVAASFYRQSLYDVPTFQPQALASVGKTDRWWQWCGAVMKQQ